MREPQRILELSRDPLFKDVYPDRTTWISTGAALEPTRREGLRELPRSANILGTLVMCLFRRFDLIVLPAIRVEGPGDRRSTLRRLARRALVCLANNKLARKTINSMFGLRHVAHIIRDISDFPHLDEVSTRLFPYASIYAKREVLESDVGRRLASGARVVYTPMPLDVELYTAVNEQPKSVDIFFAASLNSAHRREAAAELEDLAVEGFRVDVAEGRLAFSDYLQRMSRAWLTVSPKGHGEHCYRHYEALLLGSVPVINRPDLPVHYAIQGGESCVFYEPRTLAECVKLALKDHQRLRRIAHAGRNLVLEHHAARSVVRDLLAALDSDTARPPR